MARGEDTGNHPGRKVGRDDLYATMRSIVSSPQDAVAAGLVDPTSKGDMDGMHGPQCNNCGSYNTDASSNNGHDCYDCGHTSEEGY
jgi:hypothetical protein